MLADGGIVVGVDADGYADAALREAIALGVSLDRPVHAVHVVDDGGLFSSPGFLTRQRIAVEGIKRKLERWASGELPAGAPAPDLTVLFGNPVRVMLERAQEIDAAMLVVGGAAHGPNPLLGGTAERVVRGAQCPVMVRRKASEGGAVLVPVDLSEESAIALEVGARMARLRGVPLITLYVHSAPSGAVTGVPGLDAELSAYRARYTQQYKDTVDRLVGSSAPRVLVHEGEPAARITELALEEGVDLVVMGAHGRTGLARWSLGSVTESVLRSTELSVLAVRKPDRLFLLGAR